MELTIEQALRRGVTAHKEGNLQEAEQFYRAILRSQPTHPDANHNLGVLAVSLNKADVALPLFSAAVEANPKVEQFWLSYIDALIREDKFEAAKEALAAGDKFLVSSEKLHLLDEQLQSMCSENDGICRQSSSSESSFDQLDLSLAVEFREAGKYKEAQDWLNDAIKQDPMNSEALSLLSQVLLLDKKQLEAERVLMEAALISPELPSVYRNQARLLLRKSESVKALEKAQLAYKRSSGDPESILVLASCLCENQRDSEALPLIEEAIRTKPNYAEAYASRAFIKLRAADTDGAIRDAEEAVLLKPHLTQMWLFLSRLYYQNNNLRKAITTIKSAYENEPENVAVMTQLGELLRQDTKTEEAISILKMATQLAPMDPSAWTNLGVAFQHGGAEADARIAYEKALSLNPRSAVISNNLGALAKKSGEWGAALEHFERAIELEPNIAESHSNIGVVQKEMGRLKEAEASFAQAIALSPNNADAYTNLGATLATLGRLGEAEESYLKAIELKPEDAQAYYNLGAILQDQRRLEEAESYYCKSIELSPDHAKANNNLGVILRELGRIEGAKKLGMRALELMPNSPEFHYNLGITLQDLGKLEKARNLYVKAIALKQDFAAAHRYLTQVKTFKSEDDQYRQMIRLYHDPKTSETDLCQINFGLAKACEDLGNIESAFKHYTEGNAQRKKTLGYTINLDKNRFLSIKSNYSQIAENALTENKLFNPVTPIFIVGMPRSGTTLVEQIISSHSHVTGAGELNFVQQFGGDLARGMLTPTVHSLENFRENYQNSVLGLSKGALYITDKMPNNFLHLGLIAAAIPGAKIVHVKRHPKAVCWANYRQYFNSESLGYAYALKDIIEYYKLYVDMMEFWSSKIGGRIIHLDYEALVTKQPSETKRLIVSLNLPWEDNCLSPEKNVRSVATASNVQIRKKVYKGSSERWRRYEDYLKGIFDDLNTY